jgi:formylglycine-generating enzyme required for sulfatase activity
MKKTAIVALLFACGATAKLVACSSDGAPGGGAPASDAASSDSPGANFGVADRSCEGLPNACVDEAPTSCCAYKPVPGGTFPMGRSDGGSDTCPSGILCYPGEQPEHPATISDLSLGVFEVTVGRFRRFVDAYDGQPPPEGAASHPRIADSGWRADWNSSLPFSKDALVKRLKCDAKLATWTDTPGPNENRPMNCVSWYVAFAFCAWDKARLPTEAEWEYAAAGGGENRLYPWGDRAPDPLPAADAGPDPGPRDVGSQPAGKGRYGHHDLARGLFEFTLDAYDVKYYGAGGAQCKDCANLVGADRAKRGGDWHTAPGNVRVAARGAETPDTFTASNGFRCARSP